MLCPATFRAKISTEEAAFKIPESTESPSNRACGKDSPVRADASKVPEPTICPSTGTTSPDRTRMRSPTLISSTGTSRTLASPSIRFAVLGARSSSDSSFLLALPSAQVSSARPVASMREITLAASHSLVSAVAVIAITASVSLPNSLFRKATITQLIDRARPTTAPTAKTHALSGLFCT